MERIIFILQASEVTPLAHRPERCSADGILPQSHGMSSPEGAVRTRVRKQSPIFRSLGLKHALPGLDPGIHVFLSAA
jgi:hypothetical protein